MTLRLNTDFAAGLFGLLFAAVLWFPREGMGRLSIIFPRAILFVWWYAIDLLGFLVATVIIFFGLTWYLASVEGVVSRRRLAQWVPVVALLIGVFYLAFTQVLNVRLPSGIWS